MKTCSKCGRAYALISFRPTKSKLYGDGYIPICDNCLSAFAKAAGENWRNINKLCQWLDIPFVPAKWQEFAATKDIKAFVNYVKFFSSQEYCQLDWQQYYDTFKQLEEEGELESQLPTFDDAKYKKLSTEWGPNYAPEELDYLDKLYDSILRTQNVNGGLSIDQVKKLCKISLLIEQRIRANEDIDKLLGSYEKLVKIGGFTPKNVKNASDFESVGELYAWLEKRGWKPKYCTDVKRDIVDQTIADIQNYCQKLYINEPSMGEEITKRIEALKTASELEDNYGIRKNSIALDDYDMELADRTRAEEEEEFHIDEDDDDTEDYS